MASVIKEVARKLADGSYEQIPLGAKAENVKMANGNSLQQEIDNIKVSGGGDLTLVDVINIEELE